MSGIIKSPSYTGLYSWITIVSMQCDATQYVTLPNPNKTSYSKPAYIVIDLKDWPIRSRMSRKKKREK